MSGYSKSGYLRKILIDTVPPPLPPREFYDFVNEINHIGVNINQIAKVANMTGDVNASEYELQYKKLKELLSDIRKIYLKHDGR